jgi:hypothetical protein
MSKQSFSSGATLLASQMNTLQTNDYNWTVSNKTASYSLGTADAGTRLTFSASTATTLTVGSASLVAGDVVWITNLGAGTCTIGTGAGVTVNTTSSLTLAPYASGTLFCNTATSFIFESGDGNKPVTTSSGLTVVKASTAFTTATTITADNVFTSSYTSYLMYLDINWVAGGSLSLQFRASGSTTATGYNVAKLEAAAAVSSSTSTSQTSGFVGEGSINFRSSGWVKIIGPQLAQPTMFYAEWLRNQGAYTSPNIQMTYGNQSDSTQFDGIILTGSTNGMTGTYAIYGLAKS